MSKNKCQICKERNFIHSNYRISINGKSVTDILELCDIIDTQAKDIEELKIEIEDKQDTIDAQQKYYKECYDELVKNRNDIAALKAENEKLKNVLVFIKGRLVSIQLTSKFDLSGEIEMIEKEMHSRILWPSQKEKGGE